MPAKLQRITPCLWFDDQAEEAVALYASVFANSSTGKTLRYDKAAAQASGRKEGSVLTIEFELDGQPFTALNGGPMFKFSEAISLMISCETQQEVDHYWNRLSDGGDPNAQQCGWLKDKYGLSWQVVPTVLPQLLTDPDPDKARRAMEAMLQMKKIDIATLQQAVG